MSDSSLGIGRVGNMLSELGRGEEKAADVRIYRLVCIFYSLE